MAPAVRGTAHPDDVAVGFKPAEGLAHGLRLDADILRQLGLGHGSLRRKDFDGNNTGMGESDGAKFFIPGVFDETRSSGQKAPSGPMIHIRHSSQYSQVPISTGSTLLLGCCVPPATRRKTMAERLVTGDKAPAFTLQDSTGKEVSLDPRPGRSTIVY